MQIRYLVRQIAATHQHCSDNCPGMSSSLEYCDYFRQVLHQDPQRPKNKNERLPVCREYEIPLRGKGP